MIWSACFEHDLFGKPVPTFPDHAPDHGFAAPGCLRPGLAAQLDGETASLPSQGDGKNGPRIYDKGIRTAFR
jgi:hypothetical protein